MAKKKSSPEAGACKPCKPCKPKAAKPKAAKPEKTVVCVGLKVTFPSSVKKKQAQAWVRHAIETGIGSVTKTPLYECATDCEKHACNSLVFGAVKIESAK